ncbi:CD209 antigen-like protein C isoform X2 [Dendropsophus ebraccatus]|uniref:CD209 antigen-like protein C isoform X2 n=1 Tax=Dendropsophus ebraccatus TaxID=150705 RepID=UPI0038322A0A
MRNNQKMNIQDHTRRDFCTKDDVYVNSMERNHEDFTKSIWKNKAPTTKRESSGNIKKVHMILAALIFLIILFLILVAVTSVLLKYYLQMNEEISQLKNGEITCTPCPDGWNTTGCSCYYVSEYKTTWDEARDKCFNMNSTLVIVKNKTELDTLSKLYKMDGRYWIGLRRDPENIQTWKWLDGTRVSFNNWKENQPSNYLNREHCAETQSGPWNDEYCLNELYYICKK